MERYWADDSYWTDALDRFVEQREKGVRQIVINLQAVEETLFRGDGPAYRVMDAMLSVHEQEGMDGYRGAPRLVLALLQILSEQNVER